jgi:hypothetical protein
VPPRAHRRSRSAGLMCRTMSRRRLPDFAPFPRRQRPSPRRAAWSRRRGMRHLECPPGAQMCVWNLGIAAGKVAAGGVYRRRAETGDRSAAREYERRVSARSCGRSSVVERQLPKLYVAGSIPAARSKNIKQTKQSPHVTWSKQRIGARALALRSRTLTICRPAAYRGPLALCSCWRHPALLVPNDHWPCALW